MKPLAVRDWSKRGQRQSVCLTPPNHTSYKGFAFLRAGAKGLGVWVPDRLSGCTLGLTLRHQDTQTLVFEPNMAKAKPTDRTAKSSAKNPTLAALRAKIDRIDRELVAAMNQRAKLPHQIGKVKEADGQHCYDPVREEEVLARAAEHSHGPLSRQCLQAVFRELISGSRALEKTLRVAYLGPAYTYSHLARCTGLGRAWSSCRSAASARCSRK